MNEVNQIDNLIRKFRIRQSILNKTFTFESIARALENCPEDMLNPTSRAALRSLSACNCSCSLETYKSSQEA
jgi:hypothetical protein